MFTFSEEYDSEKVKLVNPWLNGKPDCKTQTGGDWYNILLTASLGGKRVHGVAAPTCEVLCKSADDANSETGIGFIRWDPTIMNNRPVNGHDLSDQFYTHHPYKGTIPASGNTLDYESGLWEPSIRSRAKSTSLLAAGIHVHGGCSIKDAITSASIIASDDIDEEAVSSAILPASHLKREMTMVSKANHRIFTRGTIQSGIVWDDTHLKLGAHAPSMDWDRITALAMYIAEANMHACPNFRRKAEQVGIPYFIVRNSWAYVSPTDYHLPPALFSKVPKVDINKYGIPSIKGAFVDHEDEVIIAITRSLDSRSLVPDTDTFRAYTNLLKAAKTRRDERRKMKLEDYLEVPLLSHSSVTASNVGSILEESNAPAKALSRAVATRKATDPNIRRTSAILSAAMTEVEAEMCAPVVDPYEQAMDSYPSASLAERYARVSGYTSFRDAFEQLGNAVYYIDTSDYVINARSILAHQTADQPLSQKKRGYDSII